MEGRGREAGKREHAAAKLTPREFVFRAYWGLRADVNFLVEQGHRYAWSYPLATVWSEAWIARQRVNRRIATDAVMMQAVIAQVLAGEGPLAKLLEDLNDGDR